MRIYSIFKAHVVSKNWLAKLSEKRFNTSVCAGSIHSVRPACSALLTNVMADRDA